MSNFFGAKPSKYRILCTHQRIHRLKKKPPRRRLVLREKRDVRMELFVRRQMLQNAVSYFLIHDSESTVQWKLGPPSKRAVAWTRSVICACSASLPQNAPMTR